jgi:hypothetical protein
VVDVCDRDLGTVGELRDDYVLVVGGLLVGRLLVPVVLVTRLVLAHVFSSS